MFFGHLQCNLKLRLLSCMQLIAFRALNSPLWHWKLIYPHWYLGSHISCHQHFLQCIIFLTPLLPFDTGTISFGSVVPFIRSSLRPVSYSKYCKGETVWFGTILRPSTVYTGGLRGGSASILELPYFNFYYFLYQPCSRSLNGNFQCSLTLEDISKSGWALNICSTLCRAVQILTESSPYMHRDVKGCAELYRD